MGITGLIPFLGKSSRRGSIKEYAGQTVAIDAYCWLHKGAFSCAEKLVMKEPTNVYVMYCMKFVNMLLSHNVKPILVFDGRYLPAKADTESKRRENRELNRKKGAELLRAGRTEEGRNYLRRSVDISHEMALKVIQECRKKNVDCIVAPYEADAQLAYLNIKNIAQVVITEDSDLLLFGCTTVMFKMDVNGNGIIIEKDRLHLSMGIRPDNFTMDKFRYMCILSGCDYLPSLPGIGLAKACKFINRTSEGDIYEALKKLPCNLNMWTLVVTDEYRDNFLKADRTFKYQLVYDPIQRRQVPLYECENESDIVGKLLDDETAFQLAVGNLDPMSLRKMDDYHPDKAAKPQAQKCKSIWSSDYSGRNVKPATNRNILRVSTSGICVTSDVSLARKRPNEFEASSAPELTREQLLNFYGGETKKSASSPDPPPKETTPKKDITTSPVLISKKNPFAIRRKKINRQSCLEGLKRFSMMQSDEVLCSRYFQSTPKPEVKTTSVLDILENVETEKEKCIIDESEDQLSEDSNTESCQKDSCEDDLELLKSSQEENILNVSNVSNEESTNTSKFSKFLFNRSSVVKCFYEESKNEESSECSEFFKSPSPEKTVKYSPKKSISPIIPRLIKTPKLKKSLKTGLSHPKDKKQGLLSQFGFQPRPKILNENKVIS